MRYLHWTCISLISILPLSLAFRRFTTTIKSQFQAFQKSALSMSAFTTHNVNVGDNVNAIGLVKSYGGVELLEEVVIPVKALQDRQIRVKIVAVSVNPVDAKIRGGKRGGVISPGEPRILGFDGSGIVTEVGPSASLFAVGDKVYYAGDMTKSGTNSDYAVVDERIVAKAPQSLSFTDAASIPLVALTAWEGLLEELGIIPLDEKNRSKKILVLPGAGGVGTFVIQIASKLLGLQVIATASRPESEQLSKELGAHVVINHRLPLKPQLEAAGISGVDYIYNAYDISAYLDQYAGIINPFGKILSITTASTESVNLNPFMAKRVSFHWELMFTRALFDIDVIKQHHILSTVAQLIDNKVLKPVVSEVLEYNLQNLRLAHEKIESGTTLGKIVLSKEKQNLPSEF